MGLFRRLANRPIRAKILGLFLVVFVLLVGVQLMLFNIMRQGFEASLQQRSEQVLRVTAINIDDKLKKIEELSYEIFASDVTQRNLPLPPEGTRQYHLAVANISNEIYRKLIGHNDVLAINYLYPTPRDEADAAPPREGFVVGRADLLRKSSDAFIRRMVNDAAAINGRCLWRRGEDNTLLLARMIRTIKDLRFTELGVMVYSVDIDRLVKDLNRTKEDIRFDLCIVSPDGPAYLGHALPDRLSTPEEIPPSGSETVLIDGVRYYVAYLHSSYTGWAYLTLARFDDLYSHSRGVESTALIVLVLCALLSVALAVRVSRYITLPLELLSRRMRNVRPEPSGPAAQTDAGCRDEAELLNRNFDAMIDRIDHLIRENYDKQLALKDAQYKMLQTQINPHFLYNTLDSVNWMAKADGDLAISSMVEALASLMRETIDMEERNIPLGEELQLLEHYLTIQRIRLQEQFTCVIDAPPETLNVPIPKLTLQPIVENCIAHGYDPQTQRVSVRVTVRAEDGWLTIAVTDSGMGFPENVLDVARGRATGGASRHGIGLKNIDERLNILYAGRYALRVEGPKGRMTTLVIQIPIKA